MPTGDEDDDESEPDPDKPGEASGLVDVAGRVLLRVDHRREWRQMFYEGWAAAVRHVYPGVLSGLHTGSILREYEQLLPAVTCHAELLDVMEEMLGELQASHCYIGAPDEEGDGCDGQQGMLGAS